MTRILNVNNYHYRRGGSDVVYFEHARLMQELGADVGYFSMKHPKNEPTPWSSGFIDELEFGNDYSLAQRVVMAGKVIFSFEARKKLAQLLDRFPADLAHLHCIYHHLSPAILPVFTERRIPVIMTAHDLKIACPAYKMLNRGGVCERCKNGSVLNVVRHRCVRDSLGASTIVAIESGLHRHLQTYQRHLSAVVCPSHFFRHKLMEWGWDEAQVTYIPNYVDARLFRPRVEPGSYALYFGRLAPEKGVATLIRSVAKAGMTLKIAGVGPEDAALRELAAELQAPVEFLGFQSGQVLHDLIRGSRCVVLPSEWYENAPMSVLESMALGKPVLGSRIGGIPELIEQGATGWLFASGSVEELTERLLEIKAMASAKLQAMGQQARALVESRFTRARYAEAIRSLYASHGVLLEATQAHYVGAAA